MRPPPSLPPSVRQRGKVLRVGQRAGVAQVKVAAGDLAQQATHDLARARLGQRRRDKNQVGHGDGADIGADLTWMDKWSVEYIYISTEQEC